MIDATNRFGNVAEINLASLNVSVFHDKSLQKLNIEIRYYHEADAFSFLNQEIRLARLTIPSQNILRNNIVNFRNNLLILFPKCVILYTVKL